MTGTPKSIQAQEFETVTTRLTALDIQLQARLRARDRLGQAFDSLVATAESQLATGVLPVAMLQQLEAVEAELRRLEQAITDDINNAAAEMNLER